MERANFDRRTLLRLATASATTLWLPRHAWSQPRIVSDPFALGVASGSPDHESVVLWSRLVWPDDAAAAQGAVTVRWEMADDEQFSRIVQKGQAQASPELGHSVHVEAAGLAPDRWYFYRFMAGDAVSAVGRTRTLPAPGAPMARLRVAYASCQRWEHGYFSAYHHMREENLDAVLFLGDYIYEFAGAADSVRIPTGGMVVTLSDYRRRYALHRSELGLQRMHAACPWFVVWDDHEVQNDYAGTHPGTGEPTGVDFAARRAAAYQAFYEHMPVRASALTRSFAGLTSGAEMRIYQKVQVGRLATVYLLDARQYKDAQVCGRGGFDPTKCGEWADPKRSLLGSQQESWLNGAFAQAQRGSWNVVAQQTLFGQRDIKPGAGERLLNDGWDGYPAARQRLLDSVSKNDLRQFVMLGGDVHENWVGNVKADYANPASPSLGAEFCGTSITSRANARSRPAEALAENPHFVYANNERRGYGVVEFTPERVQTTLRGVDDVTKPDTKIGTLAKFSVRAGTPTVERE